MKQAEMNKIAEPIIQSGFDNGADHDEIKGELVASKIPFGKVNSIFKTMAIKLELMRDPTEIKDEIEAQVTESDWESIETWDQLVAVSEEIKDEVDGSTESQIISAIRKHFKDTDLDIPKKTQKAKRTRGGKIAEAVIDVFGQIQKPTKIEMYTGLLKVSKFQRNAFDYTNANHTLFFALTNNMTLAEANAETKGMELPKKIEKGNDGEMAADHIDEDGNLITE